QVALGEVRRAADDAAGGVLVGRHRVAHVHPAVPDRLLELGQLDDLLDPADHQRPVHGLQPVHVLDLDPDPDQRVDQLVDAEAFLQRQVLGQPAVGNLHQQASIPNGNVNRTSPSTMSRMSGMPLRNCSVRSRPMPKANPLYTSGSTPHARSTFGLTMPQPPHSTQPGPPFFSSNHTSTSADGSVNGKKCGRSRVRAFSPNTPRANASSVPLRSAIVRPLSTARPSTWW